MGDTSQELLADLEKLYCPAIDSALLSAIASDFDLTVPDDVAKLRESLDEIKGLAVAQEDLPFDPSGTANSHDLDVIQNGGTFSELGMSGHGYDESLYTTTDITSTSGDSLDNSSSGNSKSNAAYTVAADGSLKLTGATHAEMLNNLMRMFPTMTKFNVDQTLKKSSDDIDKAMDILLNLSFFGETLEGLDGASNDPDSQIFVPRGIDGFNAEAGDVGRQAGRRKKRNKKQKSHIIENVPLEPSTTNKWETGKADIDFICSRAVEVPQKKVNSTYHANGMSLPSTILALALAEAPTNVSDTTEDPVMSTQLVELSHDYPRIQQTTLIGLLRITRNIISATNELAAVMIQQPQTLASDIIKVTAAPLNLEDDEDVANPQSHYQATPSTLNFEQARDAAEVHFAARSIANQQASQAARLARSNHLYGGAIAVYHERSQKESQLARQQLATASDRLVDRQSSQCDLDLHGVTVTNAIRITRERVDAWWDRLGDTKHVRGGGKHVHGGFRIVTGVGNHSHNGIARLGPSVSRMLIREGWRVEVDRGFLIVQGKART
ncbi:hypothetical protein N7478_009931 [Penicillium angulare]|uniref:uncharacterized protein n=1 Tax=Penicillium angulare TaxID=116970 RepID=UPI002541633D|nr:uncharacterized protein N7478_009931 [Penicillium angulare]KAJ5267123.1 hypothetical protein N7478_009931 [Penicillium angulare]